jgi:hypothetical protein
VSILSRFVELLNVRKNKCEIPPAPAGATQPSDTRWGFETTSRKKGDIRTGLPFLFDELGLEWEQ